MSRSSKGECARPSPLACIECRKRHLKCDASLPICSRCSSAALECVYTPSRRGYRGPSKRKDNRQHDQSRRAPRQSIERRASNTSHNAAVDWPLLRPIEQVDTEFTSNYTFQSSSTGDDIGNALTMFGAEGTIQLQDQLPTTYLDSSAEPRAGADVGVGSRAGTGTGTGTDDDAYGDEDDDDPQLVNLYYANFHGAHPMLVPRAWYADQRYPSYLRHVVQFIGSHFSPSVSSDFLSRDAYSKLQDTSIKSPFMVQALLLFSIALHSQTKLKEAEKTLARAVQLSLELGMNGQDFATMNGRQQPILEESLRRTWWEAYILDGYTAALHRKPGFKTSHANLKAPLPCEETAYAEGVCIPSPPTLTEFDMRLFADEEIQFSSFCYRIEAVRILSRVIAIAGTDEVHGDQVQAVDNALAGWVHHLPPTKADIINSFGEVDEMLFQAHMIIQCSNIFLHFPRSDLLSTLPGTEEIACARGNKQMYPASTQHIHAVKATDGSKELSNLAALRLPVQKHTPLFICGLVLSAVVQLSACAVHACHCMEQHRDRVTLIIGVLKSLSQHWPLASQVLQQIKRVGSEVLQVRSNTQATVPPESSAHDSGVDVSHCMDDNSWIDLFVGQGLAGLPFFETTATFERSP